MSIQAILSAMILCKLILVHNDFQGDRKVKVTKMENPNA